MSLLLLVFVPAVLALAAYRLPGRLGPGPYVGFAGVAHAAMVARLWAATPPPEANGWLAVDPLGLVTLTLVSVVFLGAACSTLGYAADRRLRGGRVFAPCLLLFLSAASVVCLSHHLALLWVGMEAMTLSVAPLIYHERDRRSLEAVWKYLILSSVGIALALLGTFFLAAAQAQGRPLLLEDLVECGPALNPGWLQAAFVFLLVGYGTKLGLAPMHTWKPDTYGEAPSLVSAVMAGMLSAGAFVGIARITQVVRAAGHEDFARPPLIALGLASLVIAAVFTIGQRDLKRMLAYSSIENVGLLVIGLGIGGSGVYGALLHLVNNSLVKSMLFLVVGHVALGLRSGGPEGSRGLMRTTPLAGTLLVAGLFAVTGSPPFGMFLSEFTILRALFAGGHTGLGLAVAALLALVFVGLAAMILELALPGPEPLGAEPPAKERRWVMAGPLALLALSLGLGLYLPPALQTALAGATRALGGTLP